MKLIRQSKPKVDPTGQMSLRDHIAELRHRLIVSAVAVGLGGALAFWQFNFLLDILSGPYCELQPVEACQFLMTDPLEAFSTRISVSFYVGVGLAMPVLLYQAWRFIIPGLHPNEKRYALAFVASGAILFFLGAGLAFYTVPRALEFLVGMGGDWFEPFFRGSEYLSFLIKMMVAFGIGFEFPILLVFLQMIGLLEPRQLAGARRYAIVGILIVVAVITPSGDPFSLMVLSVPMYLFYELAIVIGRLIRR